MTLKEKFYLARLRPALTLRIKMYTCPKVSSENENVEMDDNTLRNNNKKLVKKLDVTLLLRIKYERND